MTDFTPYSAALGGFTLGFAAFLLIYFNGKIAGISGILSNVIINKLSQLSWQVYFLVGLIVAPLAVAPFDFNLPSTIDLSWSQIIIGGLLVGFGSRLGSGCTSGHGICGIGRLSQRSIVATMCFMSTAIITVFISHHVLGA